MNVACPNCNTIFRVDPAKVPEAGVRARCAVCSSVFAVRREPSDAVAARTPTAPSPVRGPTPTAAAAAAPPPVPGPSIPAAPPRPPAVSRPAAGPQAPAGPAVPGRGPFPPAMPGGPRPPAFRPAVAPRPAGPAQTGAVPPPPPRPPVHAAPVAPPPTAPPQAAPTAPPASTPTASAPPAAAPVRPINPFLSQDPAAKARRLARALISDMVVYHPAKRQEGLRDGTLKQLFDEEIKKSWEEYADQVGKDVADSTPYFREALNEILADGKQMF